MERLKPFLFLLLTVLMPLGHLGYAAEANATANSGTTNESAPPPDLAEEYTFGPGDKLSITVFNEEDLSLKEVNVNNTGNISFPLLGEIVVQGRTSKELEEHITTALLNGYLKKPKVSVAILQYRMFYVQGEVNSPGGYSYVDGLTVQKGVALAGGFTVRASKRKISLLRDKSSEEERKVNLTTKVYPGDIIIVGESLF